MCLYIDVHVERAMLMLIEGTLSSLCVVNMDDVSTCTDTLATLVGSSWRCRRLCSTITGMV